MSNKLFAFISMASVQALQWSSIYIMILHLYTVAGHLPHCPLFLQMYYYLSLEVSVSRRLHPLCRAATRTNGTLKWADLYWQLLQRWQAQISAPTPGSEEKQQDGLEAMDVPSHLLSFLPTHPSPIPACSLFLTFPLCTSPSLTPGLVSQVSFWEWPPVPTREPAFPPIFLLTTSFCFPPFLIYCPND